MNAKPVGTGPYKVTEYVPGKSITLEATKDYFKDSPKAQPKIGKVVIRFIPDRQTQMAEVISGGDDFILHVSKEHAEQLKTPPQLKVKRRNTMPTVIMSLIIMANTHA